MKAFTNDGREVECNTVEEGAFGAFLLDDDEVVGYVPYDNLASVLELRSPVASSAIERVGYDEAEAILEIEFRHGGSISISMSPRRSTATSSQPSREVDTITIVFGANTTTGNCVDEQPSNGEILLVSEPKGRV